MEPTTIHDEPLVPLGIAEPGTCVDMLTITRGRQVDRVIAYYETDKICPLDHTNRFGRISLLALRYFFEGEKVENRHDTRYLWHAAEVRLDTGCPKCLEITKNFEIPPPPDSTVEVVIYGERTYIVYCDPDGMAEVITRTDGTALNVDADADDWDAICRLLPSDD